MVTTRQIHCVVVLAEADAVGMSQKNQPRFRPSDLLPWADPHIRSLVEQLQEEVREEEATRRAAASPVASAPRFDDSFFREPLPAKTPRF